MNTAMAAWDGFWNAVHFLRPDWLWALLALPVGAALWMLRRRRGEVWKRNVDGHLLPYLLVPGTRRGWAGLLALLLGMMLAVLALAGPSWRQQAQPLFHSQQPLVIALDLSSSVLTGDLPPSRLLQARAKLATLLRERRGGDVALLAYAGDSFTVAPLTEDVANVALFLDALSPEVMPVDGKRGDRAIEAAVELLLQAGYRRGDILLLTDQADAHARSSAGAALQRGFHVSVLGLGTPSGGVYRDRQGRIEQARLDEAALRALAGVGGGRYARLTIDDADVRGLGVLEASRAQQGVEGKTSDGQVWLDDGYWLLPPLMLLALLGFRRRAAVASLLALGLWLPPSLPLRAAEPDGWWQRADQLQHQRIERGVLAYRQGDFAAAQQAFEGLGGDQAQYNLGNALARQGRYDEAIGAYDRALKLHPGMTDALANRAAVEAARKRQPPQARQARSEGRDGARSPSSSAEREPSAQAQTPQPDGSSLLGRQDHGKPPAQTAPPQIADAAKQRQADQAQQQRMQRALAQQDRAGATDPQVAAAAQTPQQREQRQAVEAWMQRVPDDPGSLLRSKFRLEYERRRQEGQ